jgi:hypothetical protein
MIAFILACAFGIAQPTHVTGVVTDVTGAAVMPAHR